MKYNMPYDTYMEFINATAAQMAGTKKSTPQLSTSELSAMTINGTDESERNGHEDCNVLVKNDDGTAALYIDGNCICDDNNCWENSDDDYMWEVLVWLNCVDPIGETDVNNINVSVRHNGRRWVAV